MKTSIVYSPITQKVSVIEILRRTKNRFSVLRLDCQIARRRSAFRSLGGASAPKTVTGTVTLCQYTGQVTLWVYTTRTRLIMQQWRWRIITLEWCLTIIRPSMMGEFSRTSILVKKKGCLTSFWKVQIWKRQGWRGTSKISTQTQRSRGIQVTKMYLIWVFAKSDSRCIHWFICLLNCVI